MNQIDRQLLDQQFLHQLERLKVVNKSLKRGLYSGKRRSASQGSSIEFADYRSYTEGDDFRQIDWNAYARHEKLFLKTFLDEQELSVSIYLDCSKSMDFGSPSKFVTSIKIAAALGYLSLYNFDRLNIYSFSDQIEATLPKLMGKGKALQLFHFLNKLNVTKEGNINKALNSGEATFGKPGISIIISDFLYEDGYEKAISFIQAAKQDVILVQIFAKDEISPNVDGDLQLEDVESGESKEVSISPYLLAEYQKTLSSFQTKLASFAHKRGIAYLRVDAEMSIEHIVFKIFKQSGLIQ